MKVWQLTRRMRDDAFDHTIEVWARESEALRALRRRVVHEIENSHQAMKDRGITNVKFMTDSPQPWYIAIYAQIEDADPTCRVVLQIRETEVLINAVEALADLSS